MSGHFTGAELTEADRYADSRPTSTDRITAFVGDVEAPWGLSAEGFAKLALVCLDQAGLGVAAQLRVLEIVEREVAGE